MELLEATNLQELEELYFSKFQLHWPILHRDALGQSSKPPSLMMAILTAGLWMKGAEARAEAEFYHDNLLKVMDKELVNIHLIYTITTSLLMR